MDIAKKHNEILLKNSEKQHVDAPIFTKVIANFSEKCGRGVVIINAIVVAVLDMKVILKMIIEIVMVRNEVNILVNIDIPIIVKMLPRSGTFTKRI